MLQGTRVGAKPQDLRQAQGIDPRGSRCGLDGFIQVDADLIRSDVSQASTSANSCTC